MEIKKNFIEQIMECKWLSNSGEVEDLGFEVEYIKSKTKVKNLISSQKWENVCLEECGNFTAFLHMNYKEDYNKYWNETVRRVKSEYINIISNSLDVALSEFKGKDDIKADIKANLVTLFMINFYSEYYSSNFYNNMLKIYLSGHLPCGWNGNYPEGKFVVY